MTIDSDAQFVEISDADLIQGVRAGNRDSEAQLFRRHKNIAISVAYRHTDTPSEAEDIVSESFLRVFNAIRSGSGPAEFFRAYLLTAVSREAFSRNKAASKVTAAENIVEFDASDPFADDNVKRAESGIVIRAFKSLPERWREVLWHTEIEDLRPREIAPILGLTPNAVSALAVRAREGLREAYLAAHLNDNQEVAANCVKIRQLFPSFLRSNASKRDRQLVENHLKTCAQCAAVYAEIEEVGTKLRVFVLPWVVGGITALGVPAAGGVASVGAAGVGGASIVADLGAVSGTSATSAGAVGAGALSGGAIALSAAVAITVGAFVAAAVGIYSNGAEDDSRAAQRPVNSGQAVPGNSSAPNVEDVIVSERVVDETPSKTQTPSAPKEEQGSSEVLKPDNDVPDFIALIPVSTAETEITPESFFPKPADDSSPTDPDQSEDPVDEPSEAVETLPGLDPSAKPTDPMVEPTGSTGEPSVHPTVEPTHPTVDPTVDPTADPSGPTDPTGEPTVDPTSEPTDPTVDPTEPTVEPTVDPTVDPTDEPTDPSVEPTSEPTEPTVDPTVDPTSEPTDPTVNPTEPTVDPTVDPTDPSVEPTSEPTEPTVDPTVDPTPEPTDPTVDPTEPTVEPTVDPTVDPTDEPTDPSAEPTSEPTEPTVDPTVEPTDPAQGADIGDALVNVEPMSGQKFPTYAFTVTPKQGVSQYRIDVGFSDLSWGQVEILGRCRTFNAGKSVITLSCASEAVIKVAMPPSTSRQVIWMQRSGQPDTRQVFVIRRY